MNFFILQIQRYCQSDYLLFPSSVNYRCAVCADGKTTALKCSWNAWRVSWSTEQSPGPCPSTRCPNGSHFRHWYVNLSAIPLIFLKLIMLFVNRTWQHTPPITYNFPYSVHHLLLAAPCFHAVVPLSPRLAGKLWYILAHFTNYRILHEVRIYSNLLLLFFCWCTTRRHDEKKKQKKYLQSKIIGLWCGTEEIQFHHYILERRISIYTLPDLRRMFCSNEVCVLKWHFW